MIIRRALTEAEQERSDAFLKELAQLSLKHGFFIGGCGCCDSPFADEKEHKTGQYRCNIDVYDEKITIGYLAWEV